MKSLVLLLLIFYMGCLSAGIMGASVDPKLDFTEEAKVVEQKDSNESAVNPGVRGVRVTVDTNLKGSPESKSSDESSDSSSSSDRTSSSSVGVRTDVTFELSNETNETKSQENIGNKKKSGKPKIDKNNEEADVSENDIPIIKGRTRPPTSREHVDSTTWRPQIRPIIPKPDNEARHKPGSDAWSSKSFPNSGVWTTERNYVGLHDNYNSFSHQPVGPSWQPCRCEPVRPQWPATGFDSPHSNYPGFNNHNRNHYHYTVVDDKLDEPFSVSNRKRSHNKRRRRSPLV